MPTKSLQSMNLRACFRHHGTGGSGQSPALLATVIWKQLATVIWNALHITMHYIILQGPQLPFSRVLTSRMSHVVGLEKAYTLLENIGGHTSSQMCSGDQTKGQFTWRHATLGSVMWVPCLEFIYSLISLWANNLRFTYFFFFFPARKKLMLFRQRFSHPYITI